MVGILVHGNKLPRYDAPSIERRRCRRADLNHGPVSNKGERILSARQRSAHDEMVSDPPLRQLLEQSRHGGRYVIVPGYDNGPSQFFALA